MPTADKNSPVKEDLEPGEGLAASSFMELE